MRRNRRWRLACGGGTWREWLGRRTVGAQDWFCPVPVAAADGLWGAWDGDRAACAFFCRAAAAAAGRGEADPGGAGGGGRGVPAGGQQPGAGLQPDRAQGHRGAAGRCAGPDRAGGRAVRGGGPRHTSRPRRSWRPPRALGRGRERWPVSPTAGWPRSGSRTRRSSSAAKRPPPQVLDRMSRLLAGAGLLVVSGASGAGKSSLLRAGVLPRIRAEWAGRRAGSGVVAVGGVHPDPGAAG